MFNVGDLVKFINIPHPDLPVYGSVGVVLDKSDRAIEDEIQCWAYKIKYASGVTAWELDHALELMAKIKS